MVRHFIFADEAGDFEFSKRPNVSRYFILTTVNLENCDVGDRLTSLRRQLAWDGFDLGEYFHASTDRQAVRDRVFSTICEHKFCVQATVMEKSKAFPRVRSSRPRFYKYGWLYHFRHGTPKLVSQAAELMVIAASLGTRKERLAFQEAVDDVLAQTVNSPCKANFCPAAADPCLQIADYCAWAIQRKWESGFKDVRSYESSTCGRAGLSISINKGGATGEIRDLGYPGRKRPGALVTKQRSQMRYSDSVRLWESPRVKYFYLSIYNGLKLYWGQLSLATMLSPQCQHELHRLKPRLPTCQVHDK